MNSTAKYDLNFWKTYDRTQVPIEPSRFARFCLPYMKAGQSLLDVCCGNKRDSNYFSSKQLQVVSFDHEELNLFDKIPQFNLQQTFDNVYCRFVLHAVPEHIGDYILINANNVLKEKGLLFIEARSAKGMDSKALSGHYRRGIDKEMLLIKLRNLNFEIVFEVEQDGLSVYNTENPVLIRVVARKKGKIQTRGTVADARQTQGAVHLMQSVYLLFVAKQIFEDNNIPFFLIFGTLLGAYRDKGLIAHDTDIDLGLLEKYNNQISKLIDDGYFAIYGILYIREQHKKHHLKALQYKRDYLDLWFFEKREGIYKAGRRHTIEDYQIDAGFSTIKFYGQDFKTVHDIEKYLERHYPEGDWRIPVEGYHSRV